jgi:hypothetical protein
MAARLGQSVNDKRGKHPHRWTSDCRPAVFEHGFQTIDQGIPHYSEAAIKSHPIGLVRLSAARFSICRVGDQSVGPSDYKTLSIDGAYFKQCPATPKQSDEL